MTTGNMQRRAGHWAFRANARTAARPHGRSGQSFLFFPVFFPIAVRGPARYYIDPTAVRQSEFSIGAVSTHTDASTHTCHTYDLTGGSRKSSHAKC